MAEFTLVAESGRTIGSPSARRLRNDGRIPGVVYGPGVDPIPVSVVGTRAARPRSAPRRGSTPCCRCRWTASAT